MGKVAGEVGAMSNQGLRERYPLLQSVKDATWTTCGGRCTARGALSPAWT